MKPTNIRPILALALLVAGPAAAEPLRLEVTYSSPSPGTGLECFGFGGAAAPAQVVARFHFDSSSLPTDDVNSVVFLQSLTAASLNFGDASWTLPELQEFLLGVSPDGQNLYSLEYEFAPLATATTSNTAASDVNFQLQVTGASGAVSCAVLYTVASAEIVPDVAPPPEKTYVHHAIAPLGLAVKSLAVAGTLRMGEVKDLRNRLGLAYRDLARADFQKAQNQLALYETSVDQLDGDGRLSADDYASLTYGLESLTLGIADLAESSYAVETPEVPGCGDPMSCATRRLLVDANVFVPPGLMDGSEQFPFKTISGALDYAADLGWPCVEVQIRQGLYSEGIIAITRDTRLTGEAGANVASAFQNLDNHSLTIEDIAFTDAGIGASAALEVRAMAACTRLQDVTFANIEGSAVSQEGGALTMRNTRITATRARAQGAGSGRAVRLTGGVDACLTDVVLNANDRGAIYAEGPGTRVYALGLVANQNRATLTDPLPAGAIVARNGALLLGEGATLSGNEIRGIGALDAARAHFRHSLVTGTRAPAPDFAGLVSNAGVYTGSRLQFSSSTLEYSKNTAFLVASPHATLAHGFVGHNGIGVAISEISATTDLMQCLQHVMVYSENGVNFDAEELSVPEPVNDTEALSQPLPAVTVPVPASCAIVAFTPTWCAAD